MEGEFASLRRANVIDLFLKFSKRLKRIERAIAVNQIELLDKLNAVSAVVGKIGQETAGLKDAVANLQVALEAAGQMSPEVVAAVDQLVASVAAVDALVPDAAAEVPADAPAA
jgi:hypothetical protein